MAEQRGVAFVGNGHRLHRRVCRRHCGQRRRRQQVGIRAADGENGNVLQGAEFVPEGGDGLVELDAGKGRRERRVVVATGRPFSSRVGEARVIVPVGVGPRGELAAVQPPLDARGVGPIVRDGRSPDVAFDPRQPARLDRRPDVVEDEARPPSPAAPRPSACR